jgi:hypothetical protein
LLLQSASTSTRIGCATQWHPACSRSACQHRLRGWGRNVLLHSWHIIRPHRRSACRRISIQPER